MKTFALRDSKQQQFRFNYRLIDATIKCKMSFQIHGVFHRCGCMPRAGPQNLRKAFNQKKLIDTEQQQQQQLARFLKAVWVDYYFQMQRRSQTEKLWTCKCQNTSKSNKRPRKQIEKIQNKTENNWKPLQHHHWSFEWAFLKGTKRMESKQQPTKTMTTTTTNKLYKRIRWVCRCVIVVAAFRMFIFQT